MIDLSTTILLKAQASISQSFQNLSWMHLLDTKVRNLQYLTFDKDFEGSTNEQEGGLQGIH